MTYTGILVSRNNVKREHHNPLKSSLISSDIFRTHLDNFFIQ